MELTRWKPFGLTSFRRELDRLFDAFLGREEPFFGRDGGWVPALDVVETPEEVVVKAEVPGIDEKDISVSLSGNELVIKGERESEEETKEKHYHRVERSYGSFERAVSLPTTVDPDKICAEYTKGVLEIHLPKKPEAMPKKVEVIAR